MSQGTILQKRAAWSRLYDFDFTDFEEMQAGETLSSPAVAGTPAGLTVGAPAVSGGRVQVRVSGGAAGTVYSLTATAATSGGSTLTVVGRLEVVA